MKLLTIVILSITIIMVGATINNYIDTNTRLSNDYQLDKCSNIVRSMDGDLDGNTRADQLCQDVVTELNMNDDTKGGEQ